MKKVRLTLPQLALLAGTRVAMGVGGGLLLSGRLSGRRRKAAGWGLFLAGAASTIPLAKMVFGRRG